MTVEIRNNSAFNSWLLTPIIFKAPLINFLNIQIVSESQKGISKGRYVLGQLFGDFLSLTIIRFNLHVRNKERRRSGKWEHYWKNKISVTMCWPFIALYFITRIAKHQTITPNLTNLTNQSVKQIGIKSEEVSSFDYFFKPINSYVFKW